MSTGTLITSTKKTNPAIQSLAFVDVPRPPYPLSSTTSTRNRKENTAPSSQGGIRRALSDMPVPSKEGSVIMKRKLSHSAGEDTSISTPSVKKHRPDAPIFSVQRLAITPGALGTNSNDSSEEFPNGSVYCHQCCQRKDSLDAAHCDQVQVRTYKSKDPVEKPCKAKYCSKCLLKRYGEDVVTTGNKDKNGKPIPFVFTCPRCRGICNCSGCRKAKGLEPYGKFKDGQPIKKPSDVPTKPKPKSKGIPAGDVEMKDETQPKKKRARPGRPPKAETTTATTSVSAPVEIKPVVELTHLKDLKLIHEDPSNPSTASRATPSVPRGRPKKPPKPSIPPPATWTRIPTTLTFAATLTRFEIREFVLRYTGLMEPSIPIGLLSELDDLCGRKVMNGGYEDEESGEEIVGWVSEGCVKAMVLGMLGMLAREEDLESVKHVQTAVKEIRASTGTNLNKLWSILENLRTTLGKDHDLDLDEDWLPDPLPAPRVVSVYNTRATRGQGSASGSQSGINIIHPTQFIPIIAALVEAAIRSDVVRDSFDVDFSVSRTHQRHVRECVKIEDERWTGERDELKAKGTKGKDGKEKDKVIIKEMRKGRERHKRVVDAFEMSGKMVVGFGCGMMRWGPVGVDGDGRMYWACSPGARERKAAGEFLGLFDEDGKRKSSGKKIKGTSAGGDEERKSMGDWSLCIVVWGKPARDGLVDWNEIEDSEDEKDEDQIEKNPNEERWWGFYDPAEIRKLGDWVDWKAGYKIEEGSENEGTPLGRGLREYAGTLEWRIKEDRYDEE